MHLLIQFDGDPGSGKTTLINMVAEKLRSKGFDVVIAKEPLDKWVDTTSENSPKNGKSLLQMFYEDPSRWGYLFQTRVFVDRVNQIRETVCALKTPTVILAERGLTSDTFFMKTLYKTGKLEHIEYVSYMSLWEMWSTLVPIQPKVGIYIKPSLDQVEKRIKSRNRSGEEGIPRSYLEALEKEHDDFYNSDSYFTKITLGPDSSDSDFRVPENFEKLFSKIEPLVSF